MITIIIEQPKKKENLDKLIKIFKEIKAKNSNVAINLRIANRIDAMRDFKFKDDECVILFGSKLYQYVLKDINEFDRLTGGGQRDVHKFSYFVRNGSTHYFLACMPPVDFTMSKPETFMAFESFMKSLVSTTECFRTDLKTVFLNKSKPERKDWKLDLIENGFSPKVHLHFKYDEIKSFMYSMFDKPDWHRVAIDTETTGLQIWNAMLHDIKVMSFSDEENVGHAINMGLPGLMGFLTKEQLKEVDGLVEQYIFEKMKIFEAWNAPFDIFTICNKYNRSYRDFIRTNKVVDGMQLLHALSENRKIEGYNLKAAARDFINYAQYSYVQKYLHYLANWQTYTVEQVLEAANNSMKYAAEDAAGEFTLTRLIANELDSDNIVKEFKDAVAPKIMAVKLELEWNGLNVNTDAMAKNSIAFSGWEIDNVVKPTLKRCQEATDKKCHADLFVFSTTTGRMLYGKPFLNGMKIGTKASEYFIADEGSSLVYVDLDSADLRSAALISQDINLVNDLNAEGDYYLKFAKELFGSNVGEKERNIAKQFVLSMLNLAGDRTIASEAGVSEADVKAYKQKFYNRYPFMYKYKLNVEDFLKRNHFIFNPSFRKRRFSEDDLVEGEKGYGGNYWKSFLSAHNFPFQSTTADLMVLNCFKFIGETREFDVKQCLLNVDAAVFDVPDKHLEEVKHKFKVFEEIPGIMLDGVIKFQEYVLNALPKTNLLLKVPKFTYKLYVGKNLKDMTRWDNAGV